MNLRGKTAIVTGAARGIGAAIATLLVADGAYVVITDVLDDEGKGLANQLGANATFVHLDVTRLDQWEHAIGDTERFFTPVSVLVNNAGIVEFGAIEQQSAESFRRVLDVNLYGAWLGMRTACHRCGAPAEAASSTSRRPPA